MLLSEVRAHALSYFGAPCFVVCTYLITNQIFSVSVHFFLVKQLFLQLLFYLVPPVFSLSVRLTVALTCINQCCPYIGL